MLPPHQRLVPRAHALAGWVRSLPVCWLTLLLSASIAGAQHSAEPAGTPTDQSELEARVNQAYALFDSGEPKRALETFQQVLEDHADYLPARLGQAVTYAEQQNHTEAFRAFDLVVRANPDHIFAWNGRGLAAFNLENFDEARNSFEQATRNKPVNGFYYESLAWTYLCLGDYQNARKAAKTATLMYNQKGESSAYPLLIAYFSSLESAADDDARRTLEYALANQPPQKAWPHPVFEYLAGHLDGPELISFVQDSAQETEAHTYIGLQLRATGESSRAARHLQWVAEHGDHRVFEFTLARTLNAETKVAALDH
ncbi:MAG: tetratricopeptide repeat protein [Opitutales bacterium]